MKDIDSMPAGREMNALIAEKVMGLHPFVSDGLGTREKEHTISTFCKECGDPFGYHAIPDYSTNIEYAWKVVEKIQDAGIHMELYFSPSSKTWGMKLNRGNGAAQVYEFGYESVQLLICRCALKAIKT